MWSPSVSQTPLSYPTACAHWPTNVPLPELIDQLLAHLSQLLLIRRILDAAQQEYPELLQRFVGGAAALRAEDRKETNGVVPLAGLDHRPHCALRPAGITVLSGMTGQWLQNRQPHVFYLKAIRTWVRVERACMPLTLRCDP